MGGPRGVFRVWPGLITLLALGAACTGDLWAQAIRKEVNLVLVEATVKDRSGRVMKELKQDDFLIYEEGEAQEVAHFSRDQLPLAVALVVDLSNSIQPFLRPLRYATMTALKALKEEDQVALFTFSDEVELRTELTHDKTAASEEMEAVSAGGSTNINDALFLAAEYLRKEAPQARRVIILVSDNVASNPGSVEPSEVLGEVLEADAVIYGIRVPGRNPVGARLALKAMGGRLVNVNKIAAETGGEVFEVEKEGSLFLAFQTVIERLKTRYTLGYYPAGAPSAGAFRTVQVKLHPSWGLAGSDYKVLARRGYYAPRARRAAR